MLGERCCGIGLASTRRVCVCCVVFDLQKGVAVASPSIVSMLICRRVWHCLPREREREAFAAFPGPSVFDTVGCFRCKNSLWRRMLSGTPCTQNIGESIAQLHVRDAVQMC